MGNTIINYEKLYSTFRNDKLKIDSEIVWFNYSGFLHDGAFKALYDSYPEITYFEEHNGMKRIHGQAPHDRL